VILTSEGEFDTWLSGPWSQAARLHRPLPDGALRIVARSEKKDEAA
jgi:putative SOS response-associated peptidase YedK